MDKKLKLMIAVFLGLSSITFASGIETPSYNEVFAQQLKCNKLYFSNSPWDKKLPILAKMKTNTYIVTSKPVVTELAQRVNHNEKERAFKVSAIQYSKFRCKNKVVELPSLEKEGTVESLIKIFETKTGTGSYQITGGEPGDIQGSSPELYSNFFFEVSGNSKTEGLYCVVLIEDFLNNPTAIDVNKLCEGKPASDREATKKTIEQTRKAWIAAGVGKKQ